MDDQAQAEELYEEEEQPETSPAAAEQGGEEPEQAAWLELEESLAPRTVQRGDLVEAHVVDNRDQNIIVDLGTKYEGFIPRSEFTDGEELPQIGDTIQVAVINVDEEHERIRVSKRRADYERAWAELYEAMQQERVVTGMVTERVRGGLRVNVGLPGFVPASQVIAKDVRHLDRFVGRALPLRVVEVDRRGNKVVLSHRAAVEEERRKRREKTLARLYEGAVCEGRVVSLTDYGAFIDLGGVDGLLHVSEMAWHHVSHPSEVLRKGDIVRVVVLSIEGGGDRISLSRREILPDPWKEVVGKYNPGDTVTVEITRLVSTGAFARPPEVDVEGFIPLRELSETRIRRPEDAVKVGQKVEVKVIDLQPQAHKMTMSLTQAGIARRQEEVQGYLATQSVGTGVTLGERFGDILMDAKAAIEETEQKIAEAPPSAAEPTAEGAATPAAETIAEASPARKPRAKRAPVTAPVEAGAATQAEAAVETRAVEEAEPAPPAAEQVLSAAEEQPAVEEAAVEESAPEE